MFLKQYRTREWENLKEKLCESEVFTEEKWKKLRED
jgi:hypothetical protein